jgi:hypothetical protein
MHMPKSSPELTKGKKLKQDYQGSKSLHKINPPEEFAPFNFEPIFHQLQRYST